MLILLSQRSVSVAVGFDLDSLESVISGGAKSVMKIVLEGK